MVYHIYPMKCWDETDFKENTRSALLLPSSPNTLLHILRWVTLGYKGKRQQFPVSGKLFSMPVKEQHKNNIIALQNV